MKLLLLRLSELDADAESAVRIISFFDALLSQKADLGTVLGTTARLAECAVGVAAPARGIWLRSDRAGTLTTAGQIPEYSHSRDFGDEARVWIERVQDPLLLDDFLLERLAITADVTLDRATRLPAFGDPALLQLVVAESSGEAERSRALRLLGLVPTEKARLLAVQGPQEATEGLLKRIKAVAAWTRHAPLGSLTAVLAPGHADVAIEEVISTREIHTEHESGLRVGIGPTVDATDAAQSWRCARLALRFTAASGLMPTEVNWDELGAKALLAELPRTAIDRNADVARLDLIASEPSGAAQLEVLTAFVATESVRKAATSVYRHHSTIASRLAHAEKVLQFSLETPRGRFRLHLALLLRAIRNDASV